MLAPRGAGMTTWARTAFPDAYGTDLLRKDPNLEFLANPRSFANEPHPL